MWRNLAVIPDRGCITFGLLLAHSHRMLQVCLDLLGPQGVQLDTSISLLPARYLQCTSRALKLLAPDINVIKTAGLEA